MIIAKVPFRISFVGGGTDFEDYYRKGYGSVISTTIDKYIYVTVIHKFDNKIHLRYSQFECVDDIESIQHNLIREALRYYDINDSIEMTTISDIPARGSGLGSSSSLTVGLLQALSKYKNDRLFESRELAEKACEIEIGILKQPIGKQDQYAAAFGGFNKIVFGMDGITVKRFENNKRIDWLNQATMLFFLGMGRNSGDILCAHKCGINTKNDILNQQRNLVEGFHGWLQGYGHNSNAGELVSESWKLKKMMTPNATNEIIDNYIESVFSAGAYGAKVCGAGGGGFLMVICEPDRQNAVKSVLSHLKYLDFNFECNGVSVFRV